MTPGALPELVGVGTVIDDGSGPRLCLGVVLTSYPPQGGGPPVAGWDWAAVRHEQLSGIRWGHYEVVGTWDGEIFTLTRPPGEPTADPDAEEADLDFSTPCPEPAGGWVAPEPERATGDALDRAAELAHRLDDVGEVWVDTSRQVEPAGDEEEWYDDPLATVLNVSVVGDATRRAEVERQLRAVWGGSLCVSPAERTEAELLAIVEELLEQIDPLIIGPGRGRVEALVFHDDGTLQAQVDRQYGAGVVVIESTLRPLDPPTRGA